VAMTVQLLTVKIVSYDNSAIVEHRPFSFGEAARTQLPFIITEVAQSEHASPTVIHSKTQSQTIHPSLFYREKRMPYDHQYDEADEQNTLCRKILGNNEACEEGARLKSKMKSSPIYEIWARNRRLMHSPFSPGSVHHFGSYNETRNQRLPRSSLSPGNHRGFGGTLETRA